MVKVIALDALPASTPSTPVEKTETLIQFILDETGSMGWCAKDTIASFNEYIGSQKTVKDGFTCKVSLTKFADSGRSLYVSATDRDPKNPQSIREVYSQKNIADVPQLTEATYTPNGGTNLYDAIGSTIAKLDAVVNDNQNVLVVILTDGEENSSKEYRLEHIKKLVEERQAKGWTFVYLGANQDAWKVGATFGLAKGQTMSYSTADMAGTMQNLSSATTQYRMTRSVSSSVETKFFK